jgi:hypothetical protein
MAKRAGLINDFQIFGRRAGEHFSPTGRNSFSRKLLGASNPLLHRLAVEFRIALQTDNGLERIFRRSDFDVIEGRSP